ncbi:MULTISPECIES: helix-turn-helix domain-containing protein [Chitinophagaceae]
MSLNLRHLVKPAFQHILLKSLLLLAITMSAVYPYCHAQGDMAIQEIRKKINELLAANKNQDNITQNTADTLEYLYNESKKQGYKPGMQDAGIALMAYYMDYGTYQKVMELGNDIKATASLSAENAANLHRLLGRAYSSMGFTDNAYTEYQTAVQFAQQIGDTDTRHYILAKAYQNYINYFDRTKIHVDSILYYDTLGLKEAEAISGQSKTVSNDSKYGMIIAMQYTAGLYYLYMISPPDSSLAGKYFLEALKIDETRKGKIPKVRKIDLYTTVSGFYLSQKKYDSSVRYGLKALDVEKEFPSPYKRAHIYKILGDAYDAKHDEEQSLKYLKLLTTLNAGLNGIEKAETDAAVKQITHIEQKIAADRQRQTVCIAAGIILAILLIAFLLWRRNKISLQKKYKQLIERLSAEKEQPATVREAIINDENTTAIREYEAAGETSNNIIQEVNRSASAKESAPVNIPGETVAMLLAKLEKFEKSGKYLKKDIDLPSLARWLGTNSKYLSEIIRQHKEKTFINYINGLRIDYITHKLYEEAIYREYKINHLAEECGFASRQVFISAFKKETGVTPSYFISQLKNKED